MIKFNKKSFCFTGKLSELTRNLAEIEVRSRGGLTQKVINKELNFLVLGSIPSVGWKHGNYGNKIVKAKKLIENGSRLRIISEKDFMIALEEISSTYSGEINKKMLIFRFKSLFLNGDIDLNSLEFFLESLIENYDCHISAVIEEPFIYQDLYDEYTNEDINDLLLFQCRIVRQFKLETDSKSFIETITKGFESIEGLNGKADWKEKNEGTASFAKLLQKIPKKTKLKIKM